MDNLPIVLLLAVVYSIRDTLLVFAGAIFFAYVLSPVVALIERFLPKRRTLALGLVYIILLGGIVGLGFALIPRLAQEATSLFTRLPAMVMSGRWATLPLPSWAAPVRGQIMDAVRNWASGLEKQAVPFIQEAGLANSFRRQQSRPHDPCPHSRVLLSQRRP